MKLYLDDDVASPVLARLLRNAKQDVQLPVEAGYASARDAIHLAYALQQGRAVLSGNHDDFAALHHLVMASKGHHAGILIVRKDNDPTRDMTARGIVRAIRNLAAAGIAAQDQFLILNQWR